MLGSNLEATRYSGVDTQARADRHLHALQRAVLRRRLPDAGPLQLGQRRLRPVLPAGDHPRRRHGRGRPVRRLRPDLRPDAGAGGAAGDLLGLQPAGPEPASDPGDLGPDPDRRHGRQVSDCPLARGALGQPAPYRRPYGETNNEQAGCPRAGLGRRLERGGLHQGRSAARPSSATTSSRSRCSTRTAFPVELHARAAGGAQARRHRIPGPVRRHRHLERGPGDGEAGRGPAQHGRGGGARPGRHALLRRDPLGHAEVHAAADRAGRRQRRRGAAPGGGEGARLGHHGRRGGGQSLRDQHRQYGRRGGGADGPRSASPTSSPISTPTT